VRIAGAPAPGGFAPDQISRPFPRFFCFSGRDSTDREGGRESLILFPPLLPFCGHQVFLFLDPLLELRVGESDIVPDSQTKDG